MCKSPQHIVLQPTLFPSSESPAIFGHLRRDLQRVTEHCVFALLALRPARIGRQHRFPLQPAGKLLKGPTYCRFLCVTISGLHFVKKYCLQANNCPIDEDIIQFPISTLHGAALWCGPNGSSGLLAGLNRDASLYGSLAAHGATCQKASSPYATLTRLACIGDRYESNGVWIR